MCMGQGGQELAAFQVKKIVWVLLLNHSRGKCRLVQYLVSFCLRDRSKQNSRHSQASLTTAPSFH